MTWTTIPPWLYENDLPDGELQEWYVKAARLKVAELRARRDQRAPMSRGWRDVDFMLRQAEAFLADAEAALARYRPPRVRITAGRKVLPKP